MPSLVVRLPNHLGDACMALPALDLLAAHGARLALVGRPWAAELLAGTDWPVLALPGVRSARIRALRGLRATLPRPVAALLLTNSFSSALEFRLAGLHAAGYARDARSLLLGAPVPVPRAWAAQMHTIDYYDHLACAHLGLAPRLAPAPHLPLAEPARERARAALERAGVRGPYVVFCPVAVGRHRGRDKCWDGFGRLAGLLQRQGHQVVVCPGPGEAQAAHAAVPQARLLEPLDLGAFAALLARSRLVVANDSGPGHLAAAVGAALVGVFGVTDPAKTAPRGQRVHIVGGLQGWPSDAAVAAQVDAALDERERAGASA